MEKLINYIKKNLRIVILIISLLLFIFTTFAIFNNKIEYIDKITHLFVINMRNENLTNMLLIVTNISSSYVLIILSIILLITIKNKKIPLYISLNLISSFLISQIAKIIFSRTRPMGINLIEETGFSYPSGHAMVSMAYFGFIAYIIYKNQKNKLIKLVSIVTLVMIILLIGFSRIYLGVHYLSDIIGGFLLAIVYLVMFINSINLEKKCLK